MTSGWTKIKDTTDIERVLAMMLNRILTSEDSISHAGKFASLCNSWINCRRLELDLIEVAQVHEEIAELRKQIAESRNGLKISLEDGKT